MTKTKYSHAFLVGELNANIKPKDLDTNVWKRQIMTSQDYNDLLSDYYQSLVDSMVEAEIQTRPRFLQSVCHYSIDVDPTKKQEFTIGLTKGRTPFRYSLFLCKLHLYFFPHNIVLVVLEIDDSGVDLDFMTLGHSLLINLKFDSKGNEEFLQKLTPLLDLLADHELKHLIKNGNNLKIFQIVEVEAEEPNDNLLFEIGTFIPIGAVGGKDGYSPSKDYYSKIISENSISVFYNWKALALVDSFTVLGISGFNTWTWENLYFPLIYLRCIYEKTFCFSRNSSYRLGKTIKNISQEIEDMEKYYFYNNISYNFLPEMLYETMVKGIELNEERAEISEQIKKQVKEREERKNSRLLVWVSVFAVFSIAWDFCLIIKESFYTNYNDTSYLYFVKIVLCISITVISLLIFLIFRKSFTRILQDIPKSFDVHKKKKIIITDESRVHISTHFTKNSQGSKFNEEYTPDKFIREIEKTFPTTLKYAKPDKDGRIRLSLKFPKTIGVSNVVNIKELTDEEQKRIKTVERQGKNARSVETDKIIPTRECQIILTSDWHLITMFPGELAPPLPTSPDIHDEYWDNHVFIEPIKK